MEDTTSIVKLNIRAKNFRYYNDLCNISCAQMIQNEVVLSKTISHVYFCCCRGNLTIYKYSKCL